MYYILPFIAGGVTVGIGIAIWMWWVDRQMDKYLADRIEEEKED